MSLFDSVPDFFNELAPILRKFVREAREALEKIEEHLGEVQEREKKRAYEHLITPPVDHTRTHVTHTSSKPPQGTRMYRRRTP